MIEPKIERVLPVYPEYMHVQWSIRDPNGATGEIEVSRSGSPEGPFTVLADKLPPDTFFYQDFEVAKFGLTQNYWYRIRVSSALNPSEKVLSDVGTVEFRAQPHRFRLARKARRDLYVTLSRLNGSVYVLLKKKRFGSRCKTCYNPFTQDVVLSSCGECYGTSYTDGYHSHKIEQKSYHSFFILSGSLIIKNQEIDKGDFVIINNEKDLQLLTSNCILFEIISPLIPPYKTYAEMHKIN